MIDSEFELTLRQIEFATSEDLDVDISIGMERYIELIHNSRLLATLHAFGVSEWKHYDECVQSVLLKPEDEEIE